jgi:hypothetical protein
VDNLETAEPMQINFIENLLPELKHFSFAFNNQWCFKELENNPSAVKKLLTHSLLKKAVILEFVESLICSRFVNDFSEKLYENIENSEVHRISPDLQFERSPAVELRSEMLENIGQRICRLIVSDGYKPSDIALISTFADPVTRISIERVLKSHGILLKNLNSRMNFADHALSLSLVTLAQVCYPSSSIYPNRDHIKVMLETLAGLNPIQSSILAKEACRNKPWVALPRIPYEGLKVVKNIDYRKYEILYQWINNFYSNNCSMPLCEFFEKAFIDLALSNKTTPAEMYIIKQLVNLSRQFNEIVPKFNNINPIRGFVEIVLDGTAAYINRHENEDNETEAVLFGTPRSFLSLSLNSKVMILSSISSKNWMSRNVRELTNPYVISDSWEAGSVYSEELEDKSQRHELAVLMRNLLKRCGERVITFESNLSSGGYENDGLLSDYIDEIQSKV